LIVFEAALRVLEAALMVLEAAVPLTVRSSYVQTATGGRTSDAPSQ
jgi:hypothetical protein